MEVEVVISALAGAHQERLVNSMPSYRSILINEKGKQVSELIAADNEQDLLQKIKQRGLYCVSYVNTSETSTVLNKKKLKIDAMVVFCYQMSAMMSAGVPLLDSLKMIQAKAKTKYERAIYSNLYEEVQKGNSLSAAMAQQEGAFDELLMNMVKSGESTGSLDEVLTTMSSQYERDKKIRQKIKSAMMYPIVLLIVSFSVVMILVTFVLPRMVASFDKNSIPLITRVLMAISNGIINYWYIHIIVIGLIVYGIISLMKYPPTRRKIQRSYMHLPVIGKLVSTVYSARCARSFASLYKHGVPALDMIKLTGDVLGNSYLQEQFERIYIETSRGDAISTGVGSIEEFDTMLPAMIRVGEEVGDLEGILGKTANYFDNEAETAMTQMVALIEPVMIVVLGIIVALIVISIMLPMFQMYSTVN